MKYGVAYYWRRKGSKPGTAFQWGIAYGPVGPGLWRLSNGFYGQIMDESEIEYRACYEQPVEPAAKPEKRGWWAKTWAAIKEGK